MFNNMISENPLNTCILIEKENLKNPKNLKNLTYLPVMKEYLEIKEIDIKKAIKDFLTITKFNEKIGLEDEDFEELIDRLTYDRRIVFNYECGVVEIY